MPESEPPSGDQSFGRRLQELRRGRFTQRKLAERVGIDFTYLSKLENGRGEPPSEATVRRLAEELDADPDELLALAGKISAELRARAAEDPTFALLLRKLPHLTEDQLRKISHIADEPTGPPEPDSRS